MVWPMASSSALEQRPHMLSEYIPPFPDFSSAAAGGNASAQLRRNLSDMDKPKLLPSPPFFGPSTKFPKMSKELEEKEGGLDENENVPSSSADDHIVQHIAPVLIGHEFGDGAPPDLDATPIVLETIPTEHQQPKEQLQEEDFQKQLEEMFPDLTLSVEEPTSRNGNCFQVKTQIEEHAFYGRGTTERAAVNKCCQKAIKFIQKYYNDDRDFNFNRPNGSVASNSLAEDQYREDELADNDDMYDLNRNRRGRNKKVKGKKGKDGDTDSLPELKQIPLKNAVMMLNEMFPPPKAPQYKVISQTGPPNNPTFTMVCTIQGKCFNGEGKSKKEAKLSCSQKAIESLCGIKLTDTKPMPEKSNPRAKCDLEDWMELEGKNPVSILNELYPGIQYQLVSTSGPSHAPQFVIRASLNDMSFEGTGKSKKDAKLNASKALLVHLHRVGFDPMTGDMMSTQSDNSDVATGHSFADRIGTLVTSKYQELFGSTTYSKRRVMAGMVMTIDDKTDETAQVICVSSGTKCIKGEQLSLTGCVVNDSHAEIVTRRCLILYLYSQLANIVDNKESIFRKCPDDEGRYELRDNIGFHLFITTSPCGDARIFSLHESPTEGTNELVAKDKKDGDSSRGMLRSKIECGMGTVPINPTIALQTWDGVMSGDRLLTMACSDKILRWNALGIQGSLLTHIIKPIYLKSITVGSRYHPGHMKRALYERILLNPEDLPGPFSLHIPQLYATTSPETRQATKAHDYSVNWIIDHGQPEIVNGSTGKTIKETTSRISKKSFFESFLRVSSTLMSVPFESPCRYSEVKQMAFDYQHAKVCLTEALLKAGCGHWIEKPIEQDQFSL